MEDWIKISSEDREEILEKIEVIKRIKENVSEEVKEKIDKSLELSQDLFDNEKIKMETFEQIILELDKVSNNFAEIDFIIFGFNEIKKRIAEKSSESEIPVASVMSRRSLYSQQNQEIDDFDTTERNTEMLMPAIKKVIRHVIVQVKEKPSEKQKVYSNLYKLERHVHLYSITRKREHFNRIDTLLESLKAIPGIGTISQAVHSIISAKRLIESMKEESNDEDEPERPKTTEKRMREMIKTRYSLKLYKILHALSRMSETGDYTTYSNLTRYARCETSWARDVISRIRSSGLIRIYRRGNRHIIYATERASFTRLAKYWQKHGRYNK